MSENKEVFNTEELAESEVATQSVNPFANNVSEIFSLKNRETGTVDDPDNPN